MISIRNCQTLLPHLSRSLRRRGARVLEALGLQDAEVSVLLCDDAEIRELNAQWRGIDRATDVLSFPLLPPPEEGESQIAAQLAAGEIPPMLGDIVISVETCIRQAETWGHVPYDEAIRLWVHGLLHLCGYDHEEPQDAEQMRQKEEELLLLFQRRTITPLVQL